MATITNNSSPDQRMRNHLAWILRKAVCIEKGPSLRFYLDRLHDQGGYTIGDQMVSLVANCYFDCVMAGVSECECLAAKVSEISGKPLISIKKEKSHIMISSSVPVKSVLIVADSAENTQGALTICDSLHLHVSARVVLVGYKKRSPSLFSLLSSRELIEYLSRRQVMKKKQKQEIHNYLNSK